ncbi:hypothetical protein ABH935_009285 [Catenulispora sp. GAS73]
MGKSDKWGIKVVQEATVARGYSQSEAVPAGLAPVKADKSAFLKES